MVEEIERQRVRIRAAHRELYHLHVSLRKAGPASAHMTNWLDMSEGSDERLSALVEIDAVAAAVESLVEEGHGGAKQVVRGGERAAAATTGRLLSPPRRARVLHHHTTTTRERTHPASLRY